MRKSSRAMGARRGRLSAPWLQFHGGGAADVYIIIRVRASGNGESALNPPPPQHIPRRRSAPAPAQRRALPEHFLTPFPRTSAPPPATMHARRPHHPFPAEDLLPSQHSDTPFPNTFSSPSPALLTHPRSPDAHPQAARYIPRRRSPPLPLRSASGTKKRHRTVDVRCRMSRSTVVAVGHWGW